MCTWVRVSGLENTKSPSLERQTMSANIDQSKHLISRHCTSMQLLCHLRVMLRVIWRRELSRRWLVSYACNHFTLCWSSMPNLSTNQTSKGTLETFVWVGGKQDFLERLLCIINNDSLWQTGLNRTCNMYLWVEGPAPAYSARSRSTKPIWWMRLESPCIQYL